MSAQLAEKWSWQPDEIETARQLWADGSSLTEIGARIGRSRNAVGGLMNRMRDVFPKRGLASAPARSKAAELWRADVGKVDIAVEMGVGVSTLTRCKRANPELFPPRKPVTTLPRVARSPARKVSPNPEGRPKADSPARKFRMPIDYEPGLSGFACEPPPDRLPGEPIGLMELTERTCKWPHSGAGAAMLFCGGRIDFGAVYCGTHSDKARRRA